MFYFPYLSNAPENYGGFFITWYTVFCEIWFKSQSFTCFPLLVCSSVGDLTKPRHGSHVNIRYTRHRTNKC
jgi:hypothetical protein